MAQLSGVGGVLVLDAEGLVKVADGNAVITTRVQAGHATESRFTHYTGGQWDFAAIPTKDTLESEPGVLSSVPGSRSMWAIGFLINGSIPELGEIIGFGR